MATLTFTGSRPTPRQKSVLVVGQVNAEPITVVVDESWNGLQMELQFFNSVTHPEVPVVQILDETMTCNVPPEVTKEVGMVHVALAGRDSGTIIKLSEKLYYADAKIGADPQGGLTPEQQTPDYIAQMIAIQEETKAVAQSVRTDADNGLFDGEPGKSPIIQNGNWWIWDVEAQEYRDTGIAASGGGGGVSSYNDLSDRPSIGGILLEGNKTAEQLGLAKASQIPNVPSWAMQPKKPTYTAQEVGAQPQGDYALRSDIPTKIPNPYALTIKGKAYDGSQPVEVDVADGKTPVKGIDYFTESEIQDVAKQAAALVPASCVRKWRLIIDTTVEEDVATFLVSQDMGGNPFSLSEFYVLLKSEVATENPAILFNVLVNGRSIANNAPQTNTSSKRYYYMYARLLPEIAILAWHQCSTQSYNQKTQMEQMLLTYSEKPETATSFFLRSEATIKTIAGPGSRLRIWGVDA